MNKVFEYDSPSNAPASTKNPPFFETKTINSLEKYFVDMQIVYANCCALS